MKYVKRLVTLTLSENNILHYLVAIMCSGGASLLPAVASRKRSFH